MDRETERGGEGEEREKRGNMKSVSGEKRKGRQ